MVIFKYGGSRSNQNGIKVSVYCLQISMHFVFLRDHLFWIEKLLVLLRNNSIYCVENFSNWGGADSTTWEPHLRFYYWSFESPRRLIKNLCLRLFVLLLLFLSWAKQTDLIWYARDCLANEHHWIANINVTSLICVRPLEVVVEADNPFLKLKH